MNKVTVDIRQISPSYDEVINQLLTDYGLPSCLGNMIPPLLKNFIEFDSSEILEIEDGLPQEEIYTKDLASLITSDNSFFDDKVLTHKGQKFLQKYKITRATLYANQLKKCVDCSHIDVCSKLTYNYLITLQELNK